jgi:hypothetical protein
MNNTKQQSSIGEEEEEGRGIFAASKAGRQAVQRLGKNEEILHR